MNKPLTVFKALMVGRTIEFHNHDWVIRDGQFGILAFEPKGAFLPAEMTIDNFIRWCERMPDKMVSEIAMDIASNEYRVSRR